jgi:hypothetical protein
MLKPAAIRAMLAASLPELARDPARPTVFRSKSPIGSTSS